MNLNELFTKQAELDNRIVEEHNLQGQDLYIKKVQALKVEIAELDNETRFFKFWSNKKMDREKALEEFVDCIHFSLSIALELDYKSHTYTPIEDMDMTVLSLGLTSQVTLLMSAKQLTYEKYQRQIKSVFNHLIKYGYQLGFTEEEVIAAYYKKNETNFARQSNGY